MTPFRLLIAVARQAYRLLHPLERQTFTFALADFLSLTPITGDNKHPCIIKHSLLVALNMHTHRVHTHTHMHTHDSMWIIMDAVILYINKSDISYLITSWASNIPIHGTQ